MNNINVDLDDQGVLTFGTPESQAIIKRTDPPGREHHKRPSVEPQAVTPYSLPEHLTTMTITRILSSSVAERVLRIHEGSPKLSPAAIVQSAIARGQWKEIILEQGSSYRVVEVVHNDDYKSPNSTARILCARCAWRHLCGLDPSSLSCDYVVEED